MINRADAFLFVMGVDKEIAESLNEEPLANGLVATPKKHGHDKWTTSKRGSTSGKVTRKNHFGHKADVAPSAKDVVSVADVDVVYVDSDLYSFDLYSFVKDGWGVKMRDGSSRESDRS